MMIEAMTRALCAHCLTGIMLHHGLWAHRHRTSFVRRLFGERIEHVMGRPIDQMTSRMHGGEHHSRSHNVGHTSTKLDLPTTAANNHRLTLVDAKAMSLVRVDLQVVWMNAL